jgi:hypothetical protein
VKDSIFYGLDRKIAACEGSQSVPVCSLSKDWTEGRAMGSEEGRALGSAISAFWVMN